MKQYFINKYIFVAFAVPKIFGKQLRYKPRASARVTLTINQKQSWVWTLRVQSNNTIIQPNITSPKCKHVGFIPNEVSP